MSDEPVVRDEGRVLIGAGYLDILTANGLDTLDAVMSRLADPGGSGQVIRRRRERQNVRIALPDGGGDTLMVFAKRHNPPGWVEQAWRLLTGRGAASFGRREWDAVQRLREAGLPTPDRVAAGDRRLGPVGRESFFMSAELTGYRQSDHMLPEMEPADRAPLIDAIVRLARRFHDAGFNHRDLYLCHFFVRETDAGRYDLALIDLQRVERRCCCRRRWLVKDLAQLLYSGRAFLTDAERDRIARVYFGIEALSPAQRRFMAAVRRKVARIARHDRRRT